MLAMAVIYLVDPLGFLFSTRNNVTAINASCTNTNIYILQSDLPYIVKMSDDQGVNRFTFVFQIFCSFLHLLSGKVHNQPFRLTRIK